VITAHVFGNLYIKLTDDTPAVAGASLICENGKWHPHGQDTLEWTWNRLTALGGSCTVVDGGANAGAYAIVMACHPAVKRVYAYEPAPAVFDALKRNLELNNAGGKVVAVQAALVATAAPCNFLLAENAAYSHTGTKMLRGHGHGKCPPLKYTTLTVDGTTLDTLVAQESKIDFIKLDLEGGELQAFKGAAQLLLRDHPVLLYEYQKENTAQHDYLPEEIEKLLSVYGYKKFSSVGTIDRTATA
jgi:FkbM family methyltransferase